MQRFAAFVLGALLVSTAPALALGAYPPKIDGAAAFTYKTVGDVKMRLWVLTPEGHKPADKRPAIVFFFGGGWSGGSPEQFERHARYLASRGMVAAVADYRVKSRHKTDPRACVMDGCSAVRYLRTNAAKFGIDPNRIASGGGSAGGHVAAATGTVTAFTEPGEDTAVSHVPNALVLFNPVFDNGPEGYGHSRVADYWEKISPMHNIRQGIAPSVTFLGTNDKLIPVTTAEQWKKKVEAVGGRADVHLYKDATHGFFNRDPYYAQTVIVMDKFLASLGWLEGEPTLKE